MTNNQVNKKCPVQVGNFWRRLVSGISRCSYLPQKLLFTTIYLIGGVCIWHKQRAIAYYVSGVELISPTLKNALIHSFQTYLFIGGIAFIMMLVYPFDRKATQDRFRSIGLVNRAGIVPGLLHKRCDRENPRVIVWEFSNQGIPLDIWEDKRTAIEAALNTIIIKMQYCKGKSHILLYTVCAKAGLPEVLEWKDEYLLKDSFVLALGESLMGPVMINLAKIPHVLLGGSTGCGKSILLKLLLMQSLRKGAVVYIADFKGGVDFPAVWHEKCQMCFEEHDLLDLLTKLVNELERRKEIFGAAGCPNIDEYNKFTGKHLHRCVFACDEVAEVLDKTGLSKDDKVLVSQIENKLSVIARQGRAFGIHLILATQRPDATILSGQIRNNLDCRICGRADNVLSQIILDSTAASDQIPKDTQGRFLLYDGTMFQAYWFEEDKL